MHFLTVKIWESQKLSISLQCEGKGIFLINVNQFGYLEKISYHYTKGKLEIINNKIGVMGNLKTTKVEKVKVINEVIKNLETKGLNHQVDLVRCQSDLDKRYKKALSYNREYDLKVMCRKSDRFGESKKSKEEIQVKEEKKIEVVKDEVKESNDEFIETCLEAENEVKINSIKRDFEAATEPIEETNKVGLELVKEAIKKGVKVFYSSFFDSDKDIRKVGYKNNIVDIYYIKNIGLIEVDKTN